MHVQILVIEFQLPQAIIYFNAKFIVHMTIIINKLKFSNFSATKLKMWCPVICKKNPNLRKSTL